MRTGSHFIVSTHQESTLPIASKNHDSVFLRACRQEPTDYTPVWLMRQAGRYQKEFRAIREKVSLLELCKNPQLASDVTIMAVEMLNVDAAIIFADILLPIEPMGRGLKFIKGEGPVIERPLRKPEDVVALKPFRASEELPFVLDALRLCRQSLPLSKALIGFAGAPFTVASYLIEGGASRNFEKTKAFMYQEPEYFKDLLNYLTDFTIDYLASQIAAGADAVQVFDSWVGALDVDDFVQFVQPVMKRIFAHLNELAPTIYFGVGTTSLLAHMSACGPTVLGVDWRVNLGEAWQSINYRQAIQGNLDPCVLFGPEKFISRKVQHILQSTGNRPGHIFNLGHGILPETDPAKARFLVETVHELSQR